MSGQTIEWGVLVTLPGGEQTIEESGSLALAINYARRLNQQPPLLPFRRRPSIAKAVYRVVEYGDWMTDSVGDQWGVRETWTDGHVETRTCHDRNSAELSAGVTKPQSKRIVVSRSMRAGDWSAAEVAS